MSGALCAGSGARLAALATQIDNSVLPAIREVPWRVTALPAARQWAAADAALTGPTYFSARFGESISLAADTTLQTLVSVSGSGFLEFAGVFGGSASGTVRIVITIDGADILDATGASVSAVRMLCGCGTWTNYLTASPNMIFEAAKVPFRSSLVLKAQQSATGIAAALLYRYMLAEPYTA